MEVPAGYELPSSGKIAAAATVPRIVTGRFRTLEEAEQVLRDGVADLVSMVRAQIADPDLVRKTREGRADDVRPCIACNQGCIGGISRGGAMGCLVNPAVGFERELSDVDMQRTALPKKVLVVGAGPAGLEAARVASLLGHAVTLAEATNNLGGAVNAAKRAPFLHTFGDITYWLEQQVYKQGIQVKLSTFMDADAVRRESADVVIIATGSQPRMDGVQAMTPWEPAEGVDLPHVRSSVDLLYGQRPSNVKTALVLDDVGHYEAIAVTDYLISAGIAVTFVTRYSQMTPAVEHFDRTTPAMERFNAAGVRVLTNMCLTKITPTACEIRPIRGTKSETIAAELVVLVTPNVAQSDLFDELRSELSDIHLIGDASHPRDALAAIKEGRRTAMQLG
jgi:thioredoxin reductase